MGCRLELGPLREAVAAVVVAAAGVALVAVAFVAVTVTAFDSLSLGDWDVRKIWAAQFTN